MSSTPTRQRSLQTAVWFEIPVENLERAVMFYQQLFETSLRRETFGPMQIAVFPPKAEGAATGCLARGPAMTPAANGSLIYLNAEPSLDAALDRVAAAGGHVVQPRTALPPGMGFFAHIEDTEGNRIGLHAPN